MNRILIATSLTLATLISGCSTTSLNTQKRYIKYDNTNHIIGNKYDAIEVVSYNEFINGKQDVKITFYVDKLPYTKHFNLCKDKQTFQRVKSIRETKEGTDKLTYETVNVDCTGYINIDLSRDKTRLVGEYTFNLLRGFNIGNFHGHDMLLPERSIRGTSDIFFKAPSDIMIQNYKEEFWVREKNK